MAKALSAPDVTDLLIEVLGDVLGMFGGSSAGGIPALRAYRDKKARELRDVLLDEMQHGNISRLSAATEDDAIAVVHRIAVALRDGKARRNLRLLAKTALGLSQRDQLYSDEFNRYAEILARMTRDQIFVAGRYFHHWMQEARSESDQEKIRAAALKAFRAETIPRVFQSEQHIEVIYSQLTGLGFLVTKSAFDSIAYYPSPLLAEVAELTDFNDALRREGDWPLDG